MNDNNDTASGVATVACTAVARGATSTGTTTIHSNPSAIISPNQKEQPPRKKRKTESRHCSDVADDNPAAASQLDGDDDGNTKPPASVSGPPRAVASLALTSQIILWGQAQRAMNEQLRLENQQLNQRLMDLERRVRAIEHRQRDVLDVRQNQLHQQNQHNMQLLNRVLNLLGERNNSNNNNNDDDDDDDDDDDNENNLNLDDAMDEDAVGQSDDQNDDDGDDDDNDEDGATGAEVAGFAAGRAAAREGAEARCRPNINNMRLRPDADDVAANAIAAAGIAAARIRLDRDRISDGQRQDDDTTFISGRGRSPAYSSRRRRRRGRRPRRGDRSETVRRHQVEDE
jgi:hypothetical protein